MKLILSRKGFDSSAGGCPSPVLPDGRLLSLPIPDPLSIVPYSAIRGCGGNLGDVVVALSGGRVSAGQGAHLDPDLVRASLPRQRGWRPLLGQSGAAQGHLRRQGVGPGDLFLFFGLYRDTHWRRQTLLWNRAAPPRHILWGWLQVDTVHAVDGLAASQRRWAACHPHLQRQEDANNTLYIARRRLAVPGLELLDLPGAGIFPRFHPDLQLTDSRAERPSRWRLPAGFLPVPGRPPLSYHANPDRWSRDERGVSLDAVARGQEFVLDGTACAEVLPWLRRLLQHA